MSGDAFDAATLVRRAAVERAAAEHARAERDVTNASRAVDTAETSLDDALSSAREAWSNGSSPARLALHRRALSDAVDACRESLRQRQIALGTAREHLLRTAEALASAKTEEAALERAIERRASVARRNRLARQDEPT